ncbi:MAG TPA: PQQ-binding-like beta-propeller repeat protein [Gammaproteobacteria bacterium]|nr:PQQ-binding-like beta-propeller repeat protein [Gammaproteobacteria bacterium]
MQRNMGYLAGGSVLLLSWAGAFAQPARIEPAPAFSAGQLVAPPTDGWITNGGNVLNQRYSPLTQVNSDNVDELRALWRTGMGTGAAQNNSGQAQILAYDGVLYVINGVNAVFALTVETGEILWTYHGNPDPGAGSFISRSSRGVALGDGKVFAGLLDARLVAIDQTTGDVVWDVQAVPWQDGFSITSAPLYYDGMVITGFSGGETASRGKVRAFDAEDGSLLWTFNTIPGPGELGHDTWPADSDAWQFGGGPVWQTPAVDPDLGLIYFSTGNPGPDLNGSVRPGDNLFTNSLVAIDAATGEYRWHFQQVHHDLWDYDSPNPVILFDAEVGGEERRGLAQVGKTGWAYILDRETGEPLIGIEERPVPQEPRQATAATQPFPIGDAIVPQSIEIPPEGGSVTDDGQPIEGGRIFTPFWDVPVTLKPGTMGGANWPPSSFDPETNLLYVCASDRANHFVVEEMLAPPVPNQVYMGGRFTQTEAEDRGIFAALDVTTNRLVWRQQWREICYSGSVVTAGGLLFVGRADGRVTALDKRNGRPLWEFQTDAGINTTVTTFEHEGRQMVVVHAGGGVFQGSTRGDGIWMFSLDGTMNSLPAISAAPGGVGGAGGRGGFGRGGPGAAPAVARDPDPARGREIYLEACVACHGAEGDGGRGGGPTLIAGLDAATLRAIAASGRNTMPGFAGVYSAAELDDVVHFIVEELGSD